MHLAPDQLVDLAEGAQTDGAAHAQSCEQCRVELAALKAALAAASDVEVPEPPDRFALVKGDQVFHLPLFGRSGFLGELCDPFLFVGLGEAVELRLAAGAAEVNLVFADDLAARGLALDGFSGLGADVEFDWL